MTVNFEAAIKDGQEGRRCAEDGLRWVSQRQVERAETEAAMENGRDGHMDTPDCLNQ